MKNVKPFVKWAGGKRQLLPDLEELMPKEYHNYFECFLGGGALFFHLCGGWSGHKRSYLSDINEELITAYKVIKERPYDLIDELYKHKNDQEHFLKIRNIDRTDQFSKLTPVERAGRFIYLNKTCFNGLYRVNSKGHFNVSFGHYETYNIDESNLMACHEALQYVNIRCGDYQLILDHVHTGDFVYLDPPYIPLSVTSSFTMYSKDGFTMEDHEELKEFCEVLNKKGVYWMQSNSSAPIIDELYEGIAKEIIYVDAKRKVAANAEDRITVKETIIRNYK